MKTFLHAMVIMLVFLSMNNLVIAGGNEVIAKINFTMVGFEEEGWTSVYGAESTFPINLGNGLTLSKSAGNFGSTDTGATNKFELDTFPPNVTNSANYLDNSANIYTINLTIAGLDSKRKYTFDIFANGFGSTERITTLAVGTKTVSFNAANHSDIITFSDLEPNSSGEIVLSVKKVTAGQYAFISGLIVTKQSAVTSVKELIQANNIRYYPVPANDYLIIDNLPEQSRITVYDSAGRKLIEKANGNSSELKVDLNGLKKGIYIFNVSNAATIVKSFEIIKN